MDDLQEKKFQIDFPCKMDIFHSQYLMHLNFGDLKDSINPFMG